MPPKKAPAKAADDDLPDSSEDEDVEKALKSATAPAAGAGAGAQGGMGIPPIPAVDFSKFGPVEEVEMSRIKKLSGPALHRSWLNIPHVTNNEEADIMGKFSAENMQGARFESGLDNSPMYDGEFYDSS